MCFFCPSALEQLLHRYHQQRLCDSQLPARHQMPSCFLLELRPTHHLALHALPSLPLASTSSLAFRALPGRKASRHSRPRVYRTSIYVQKSKHQSHLWFVTSAAERYSPLIKQRRLGNWLPSSVPSRPSLQQLLYPLPSQSLVYGLNYRYILESSSGAAFSSCAVSCEK